MFGLVAFVPVAFVPVAFVPVAFAPVAFAPVAFACPSRSRARRVRARRVRVPVAFEHRLAAITFVPVVPGHASTPARCAGRANVT